MHHAGKENACGTVGRQTKKEDRENFQDVLDSEMKNWNHPNRPKLNDSNKMQ